MASCTKSEQGCVHTDKNHVFNRLERFFKMSSNSLDERKAMIWRGVEKRGYNALILKPEF
jgi:hypothetical protein